MKNEELDADILKLADILVKVCPKEYDAGDMIDHLYSNMEVFLEKFGLPKECSFDDYQADCILDKIEDDLIYYIEEILRGNIVVK